MPNRSSLLIVDDVPDNLRLLSAMLQQEGYQVRSAARGKRALQAASIAPPDLVLLDINMPEMNGLEVCARRKADEKLRDIPVIFISALSDTEDKIRALDAGGVDYIAKPFQEREVLARVKTHLQLRQQKLELEKNYRRLKELEQLRDSLTHMVVHDMKNPLMVIDGHLKMIELFEAEKFSKEAASHLAEARTATSRLARMTAEILMVSKLEAGKLTLHSEPGDLVALARRVATDAQLFLASKQLKIVAEPAAINLSFDHKLMERVFQNLLDNALKFSPDDGTVLLALTTGQREVRVEITDKGPGIAPEHHTKIFRKFAQVESRQSWRGTGLGLTFCSLAVEAHGGEIGVASSPGKGSTFWFTLPAR